MDQMIESISADKTVAVVVGVERYGLGPRWELDGVAQDALEFAQWLVDRRVKKIRLYLSPLNKNIAACDAFSAKHQIHWLPATQQNVMDGLAEKLHSDPELVGDLLFLFWSGHGVAGSDRERHLLFENATPANRSAVNFNDVMRMLRDANRRKIAWQVAVVDACANYEGEKDKKFTTDGITVSGEGPNPAIKQFVLYGSSIGERSEHYKERRTSAFSSELLQQLKQHQATATQHWPNVNRLRDKLKAHFDRLKRENKGSFTQTPASLRWQWPDEDDGSAGVEMDALSIARYLQARRLFDKLKMLENCPTEMMHEAYWLTLQPRQNVNYEARGLEGQIEELAKLPPRKRDEAPPLFEFALRLEEWEPVVADFVKQEMIDASEPLSSLASLRKRFQEERAQGVGKRAAERYIVFDLGGDQIEYWRYRGSDFEIGGDNHGWLEDPNADQATQISSFLKRLEADGREGDSYFLEFLVRFDAPNDMHSYDEWKHIPFPLGQCYPIAVRWRDRTVGRGEVGQALWREKAKAILARKSVDQPPPLRWLPDPTYKLPNLHGKHEDDCIGFAASQEEMWETLKTVLLCGVPFAFWPRRSPHDSEGFKTDFGKAISGQSESIDQLRRLVKELRVAAAGQDSHFCAAVTLLWDDPSRDPLNFDDDQLAQPDES